MTGPRPLPSPTWVPWYEVAATILAAGAVGGFGAWLVARWRGW